MQIRPIEDLASFVRDLGSECTTLNMGDNFLLAGSKIGRITLWDTNTGQEKWTTEVEGPISDLEIDEKIYLLKYFNLNRNIIHEKNVRKYDQVRRTTSRMYYFPLFQKK